MKNDLTYIDIADGETVSLNLNYARGGDTYKSVRAKVVQHEVLVEDTLRYIVELLEDTEFTGDFWKTSHRAYKKGDVLGVHPEQCTETLK